MSVIVDEKYKYLKISEHQNLKYNFFKVSTKTISLIEDFKQKEKQKISTPFYQNQSEKFLQTI